MSDPIIPAGQAVFFPTAIGVVNAGKFPRTGMVVRADLELLLAPAHGVGLAVRLDPHSATDLALLLLRLAEDAARAAESAAEAANAELEAIVETHASGGRFDA